MFASTHNRFPGYFICLLLVLTLPFAGRAQALENPPGAEKPNGIVFAGSSFKEALRQAGKLNKYIFVDAYANWCGPCKLLRSTTFRNKKAADFYNANFINVSIDMEKGEGPDLSVAWGIQAYPTLIIFDRNGKAVLGTMGYMDADDLIRFGKQALGVNK
jgi:thioredoxin 1